MDAYNFDLGSFGGNRNADNNELGLGGVGGAESSTLREGSGWEWYWSEDHGPSRRYPNARGSSSAHGNSIVTFSDDLEGLRTTRPSQDLPGWSSISGSSSMLEGMQGPRDTERERLDGQIIENGLSKKRPETSGDFASSSSSNSGNNFHDNPGQSDQSNEDIGISLSTSSGDTGNNDSIETIQDLLYPDSTEKMFAGDSNGISGAGPRLISSNIAAPGHNSNESAPETLSSDWRTHSNYQLARILNDNDSNAVGGLGGGHSLSRDVVPSLSAPSFLAPAPFPPMSPISIPPGHFTPSPSSFSSVLSPSSPPLGSCTEFKTSSKGKGKALDPSHFPFSVAGSSSSSTAKSQLIEPRTDLKFKSVKLEPESSSSHTKESKGKAAELDESTLLSSYTCPVCFCPPTNATLTPCGHVCCGSCLFSAVKSTMRRGAVMGGMGNEGRCPVCRAIIPGWDGKGAGVIGLKMQAVFSL